MSTLFDDLQEGLLQAIDFANGEGPARVVSYKIEPVDVKNNVKKIIKYSKIYY